MYHQIGSIFGLHTCIHYHPYFPKTILLSKAQPNNQIDWRKPLGKSTTCASCIKLLTNITVVTSIRQCPVLVTIKHIYLVNGWASSSILGGHLAFLAASLTTKASGLNCTWSMVARVIGLESSWVRVVAIARLAERDTSLITDRACW